MFSLTMPMAMLVLFSQVFRSVADGPDFPAGVSYIDFLTPAMLAVTTVMAGTNAGVAAAIDHTNGLHDRFAALPMPRALPGAGPHDQRDRVRRRPSRHPARRRRRCSGSGSTATAVDAVAGLVVLVVLAGAMSALFGRIGDRLRRPDVVQFAGMMVMMPFMFVSSAFAPLDTMPGWMRSPRRAQPGRPRRRRPARQRARHRHRRRHRHRPRRRRRRCGSSSPPPRRRSGAARSPRRPHRPVLSLNGQRPTVRRSLVGTESRRTPVCQADVRHLR